MGTPTVLLLVHGGALAVEWAAGHVGAILDLSYPASAAARSVAARVSRALCRLPAGAC
jgi:hypothetical protein